MKLRILGAALAATLTVTGLASCRTNVGTAAVVNGHRITESDVTDYLTPTGPDPSYAAQAEQSGQSLVPPRTQILQVLIYEQLFERALAKTHNGNVPSEGEIAALHDKAAASIMQTPLTGNALDRELRRELPKQGIEADFVPTLLRFEELEYAVVTDNKISSSDQLVAVLKRSGARVRVGARYGTWDTATLSLDGKPVVPAYLHVQSAAAAS